MVARVQVLAQSSSIHFLQLRKESHIHLLKRLFEGPIQKQEPSDKSRQWDLLRFVA